MKTLSFSVRLMLALLLLLPFGLFGQIKRGFKLLNKDTSAAALREASLLFQRDTAIPSRAAAAYLGLARAGFLQMGEDASLEEWEAIGRFSEKADALYRKMKPKERQKIGKLVNQQKIAGVKRQIQKGWVTKIDSSGGLLDIDRMAQVFGWRAGQSIPRFTQVRREMIREALRYAYDYETLSSLMRQHRDFALQESIRIPRDLSQRLLRAFIIEYRFREFKKFTGDHPDHWAADDCWVEEFSQAAAEEGVVALLDFIIDRPWSVLDFFACLEVRLRLGDFFAEKVLDDLSPKHQKLAREILLGHDLHQKTEKGSVEEISFSKLVSHIEYMAPRHWAYELMGKAVNAYLRADRWNEAEELVQRCRALFPDEQPAGCATVFNYYQEKQPWFAIATEILSKPAEDIPVRPVSAINTPDGDEISPLISADGKTLYLATFESGKGKGGEDIRVSYWRNNGWTKPEIIEELCGEEDEAPLSLTADGREMLLFRAGKLFTSRRTEKGWSEPEALPVDLSQFEWVGKGSWSADGNTLIFEAAEKAGIDFEDFDIDLYLSRKGADGKWSLPVSLGPEINTDLQERAPYLHADGRTLYFSSKGHAGLGDLDMFRSQRLGSGWTSWTKPENFGKEFNTLEDDWGINFSVSTDGTAMYFSSGGALNSDDIFTTGLPRLLRPQPLRTIQGQVSLPANRRDEAFRISARDPQSGKEYAFGQVQPDGSFFLLAPDSLPSQLSLSVETRNYFSEMAVIPVDRNMELPDTLQVVFLPEMIRSGQSLPLRSVLFETNSHQLSPQSFRELDRVAAISAKAGFMIEVSGHTDNEGSEEYNRELSFRRASAVCDYLKGKGIPAARLYPQGLGDRKPVANNQTEAGKAKNRRVEIAFRQGN